jgi:signal transduction histidine kinase
LISVGLQQFQSAENLQPAERLKLIEGLKNETVSVASEVQALSHQLHSSKLEHLGLVPAIRGLCREISEHALVRINFMQSNLPMAVPPDVALALFRITQESLHNAVKYSGVRDFTVRLQGTETHIELMISDHGVGFDVSAAKRAGGLGLISMRERIIALKGTLSIDRSQ